jgi:DNA-binding protein HU-beta
MSGLSATRGISSSRGRDRREARIPGAWTGGPIGPLYLDRAFGYPAAFCEEGVGVLNKGELVEALALENDMSVSQSKRYLESLLELIEKKIKKGEDVNITGFGKFEVVKRAGRKGRNPATGEAIKVPARKAPKFTPGVALKRSIAGK